MMTYGARGSAKLFLCAVHCILLFPLTRAGFAENADEREGKAENSNEKYFKTRSNLLEPVIDINLSPLPCYFYFLCHFCLYVYHRSFNDKINVFF